MLYASMGSLYYAENYAGNIWGAPSNTFFQLKDLTMLQYRTIGCVSVTF